MQTLLVHTRQPFRLVADLGLVRTLVFLSLLGAVFLVAAQAELEKARAAREAQR